MPRKEPRDYSRRNYAKISKRGRKIKKKKKIEKKKKLTSPPPSFFHYSSAFRELTAALFNAFVRHARNRSAVVAPTLRVQFILPPTHVPPCDKSLPHPFAPCSPSSRARIFERPFTAQLAEGRGVNEEPQVARKARPFALGGNSIRRWSVGRSVVRSFIRPVGRSTRSSPATFTELRVFLPTLHSIYTSVEVRSATVDWSYALTPRE